MKVSELYADERRRSSNEAYLGDDWTSSSSGDPFAVYWIEATGEVFALRHGPIAFGPGTPKPDGVYFPDVRPSYPEDQEVTVLGTCPSLEELTGYDGPRVIESLRERLG
jgi:hypothetical protein